MALCPAALIPLIVFWIYPILRSVYISFTDWDYMSPTYNFVFLDNFTALFQDARFYDALWNTLVFTVGTLIPTIVLGLILALLMQKAFKGSGIIKFILFSRGSPPRSRSLLCGPGSTTRIPGSQTRCWNFCIFRRCSGSKARIQPCSQSSL